MKIADSLRSLVVSRNILERVQRVLNMARHLELIVEGATDYALGVYDVGDSGCAESESAAHIVKTADFSLGVASEPIWNSNRVAESLIPICAVCTYANYYRIKSQ